METYIAYFDETGDDGISCSSSDHFVLTSLYMPATKWKDNYDLMRELRKDLRLQYGFHITQEMHTKHFLTDKNPYRNYGWTREVKQDILNKFVINIANMDLSVINVIIDKTNIRRDSYPILENALTYNIQRIENDSQGKWNYIIITDEGRISPMRKTARAIRAYNPIQSKYSSGFINRPIANMIEDIMEKNSEESYFIQICDFISFFTHLYFKLEYRHEELPKRVYNVIDDSFVKQVLRILKEKGKLNTNANPRNEFGLVIYPKN